MGMKSWIKEIREDRDMTLAELAEKTNTTHQQISNLELGKRKLTWEWVMRLSEALQCHPLDLTTGPAQPKNNTERELLEKFRGMNETDKPKYVSMADVFLWSKEEEKK